MNPRIHNIMKMCGFSYEDGHYYIDLDDGIIYVNDLPKLGRELGKKWTRQTREGEWHGFVFRRWRG